jgi:hypothetical protein
MLYRIYQGLSKSPSYMNLNDLPFEKNELQKNHLFRFWVRNQRQPMPTQADLWNHNYYSRIIRNVVLELIYLIFVKCKADILHN